MKFNFVLFMIGVNTTKVGSSDNIGRCKDKPNFKSYRYKYKNNIKKGGGKDG